MYVRFAILGARGLIGGAVARRARFSGHQVRAVVRPGRETGGFPAGIEVVPADLRSRESVVEAVRGMDVLVHAATVPYPEWPRFVPLLAENALAAAEASGATLVFPGNLYVYGRPRSRSMSRGHIRSCRGTSSGSPTRPRGRASPLSESSAAGCTVWSVSSTRWRGPRSRWPTSSTIRSCWMDRSIDHSQEAHIRRRHTRKACRGHWSGSAPIGQELNTAASS